MIFYTIQKSKLILAIKDHQHQHRHQHHAPVRVANQVLKVITVVIHKITTVDVSGMEVIMLILLLQKLNSSLIPRNFYSPAFRNF